MDESTIFQKPDRGVVEPSPVASAVPVSPPSPSSPPPPPPAGIGFPFGGVLKGIVILGVLVLLGFIVFRFVLPLFSNKGNGRVQLSYWGLWEDKAVMQPLIDDFSKQHPTIDIVYEKQDGKQYKDRLLTRMKNGNGPDIFRFHNTWVKQLSGILAPLPANVADKATVQAFYQVVQTDLVQNGAMYGIPLSIDTLELFTNTETFQAAGVAVPKTWQEFDTVSRSLTVKDQSQNSKIIKSGAALGTFDNITHAPDIIAMLLIQNGADLKNLSNTTQNASDALNFYTSFAIGEGKVWDETLDPSMLSFAKGDLAMYFGYSWDVFTIKALNPTLNFQISSVPRLPGKNTTIASYWVEGVSAKSKNQKEAFLFLQYLSRKETEQKLFTQASKTRIFGPPYARVDLADSLKDNVFAYPFVQGAKDASSSFFASDTYDTGLNGGANQYLGNAVKSILSNVSPQSAVDTLSQGVDQVLSQYGIK